MSEEATRIWIVLVALFVAWAGSSYETHRRLRHLEAFHPESSVADTVCITDLFTMTTPAGDTLTAGTLTTCDPDPNP